MLLIYFSASFQLRFKACEEKSFNDTVNLVIFANADHHAES